MNMKTYITALTTVLVVTSLHAAEYHVSTSGLDGNNGSKSKPFKTISAAAKVARSGDVITVHKGVYRERVNPPRGGESDNNMFLSSRSLTEWSQGAAYVHNLIAGSVGQRKERRKTPYFKPHTVEDMKLSDIQHKDQRYYNNLFVGRGGLSAYGKKDVNLQAFGNVFLAGAKPSTHDRDALVAADSKPGIKLEEKPDGWWLEMAADPAWTSKQKRAVVTTEALGKAKIPDAPFEQPDGTPYRLDTDYFGKKRNTDNPAPGPFEFPGGKKIRLKVWPRK